LLFQLSDNSYIKISPYFCIGIKIPTGATVPLAKQSADAGGFYLRQQIARSVFVSKKLRKLRFLQPKTLLAQPAGWGRLLPSRNLFKIYTLWT